MLRLARVPNKQLQLTVKDLVPIDVWYPLAPNSSASFALGPWPLPAAERPVVGRRAEDRSELALNWDAVGAIGEMLGAAGVIVSLAYLAVQIRQSSMQTELNTKALRATAFQNLAEHQATLFLSQVTNSEVRTVVLKARGNGMDALTDDERVIYGAHTRMIIRSYFNAYNLLKESLITDDQWSTLVPSIVRETTQKAFSGWWTITRKDFPPDFANLIDQAMLSETREL